MAEIHVQRKRRSLWWLWLLIILALAAVVYWWYTNHYRGNDLTQSVDPVMLTSSGQFVKLLYPI